MKKAERILDLIAFLLNARRPMTFEEIQHAFPEDYGEGDEEAIARKFERDKADILQLGLPLKFLSEDEAEEGAGYLIDRKSYALPELALAPEELAMLSLAGSAALATESSPFRNDLVLALNKILFAAGAAGEAGCRLPTAPLVNRLQDATVIRRKEYLDALHRAIASRKNVMLFYHGLWSNQKTHRKVDPYGLVCVRGSWFLVGRCHVREAIRVFHVDRITGLEVNRFKPKSPDFEFPAGLKVLEHVPKNAWAIRAHEPVLAVIRFEAPVAAWVASELGGEAKSVTWDNEACTLTLSATYQDGLLPLILAHRQRARVLAPPELVEKTRAQLGRLCAEVAP